MAKKKSAKKKAIAKKTPARRKSAAKKTTTKKTSSKKSTSKKKASAKKVAKKTARKPAKKKSSLTFSAKVTKKAPKKKAGARKVARKVAGKKTAAKTKHATSHLRKKPEDVLASIPAQALERMDGIAQFRAAIRGMGVDSECTKCGFTGRYVQRQVIYVEPGSHYFRDKRRRTYLHLICMQCGNVELYCPEAIGMTT